MSTPWKILGIKAGSDRDTIRRAYAKKLKGVNPEDDPEGFMRLRQAHDDALAQLKWRQQLPQPDDHDEDAEPADLGWVGPPPDGPHGSGATAADALPDAEPSSPPPRPAPPAPDPETQARAAARAAEQADLAARQQAFIDAIADGPDGQQAALHHLLAAPALESITTRARIEGWIAATLCHRLPASDPLVVPVITLFGWGEIGAAAANADVAALLQRRQEGEFVARIARPHADLNQGYKALSRPPGPRWRMRLSALFGGRMPGEVAQILGLADGPLPGIADWLDKEATAFWRDWLSKPRLRLWMILTMFPLAAVALVAVLEPLPWPEGVKGAIGLIAYAAPFGLLWLLGFRRRFLADWQRPDWQYRAWAYAVPALPLLAAAWPPFVELGPLWLLMVTAVVALVLVSVQRLLPDAPKTLMIGLIRAGPAWFFLGVLLVGAPMAGWAKPVLGLLVPALAIVWWQGGDELSWQAQRWLGRWTVWAVSGLAGLVVAVAGGLLAPGGETTGDANIWLPRALALLPLALILLLIGFRLASGWLQAVPLLVLLAMMQMAIIATPDRPSRLGVPPLSRPGTPAGAVGEPMSWIAAQPLLQGQKPGEYRFRARLDITDKGRVSRCVLEDGTGVAQLDQAICPDLKRNGHYVAALGGDGRWVASAVTLSGGWTVRPGTRPQAAAPPPIAIPTPRLPEPVISCAGVGDGGTGPMVAEPCMPEKWVQDGEYPAAALALGQSGLVGYRLLVDVAGRVESCDIVESSGHAALDKGTCDLIERRARFVPARGVDGQPMPWSYRGRVKWALDRR